MIIYNKAMNVNDVTRDRVMPNGEKLTLYVEHRLTQASNLTGWFISICTNDENDEHDWGFCSGWCSSYPEALQSIKSHSAYKAYPFFD